MKKKNEFYPNEVEQIEINTINVVFTEIQKNVSKAI